MPTIHEKNGKKYFILNKKKVFIDSKMSKKDIMIIYKLLKRKFRNKGTKNVNSAKAVVNIISPIHRRRVEKKHVQSAPPGKATVSSWNAMDKDVINSLINRNSLLTSKLDNIKNIDYSPAGRFLALTQDPRFIKNINLPPLLQNKKEIEQLQLDYDYGNIINPQVQADIITPSSENEPEGSYKSKTKSSQKKKRIHLDAVKSELSKANYNESEGYRTDVEDSGDKGESEEEIVDPTKYYSTKDDEILDENIVYDESSRSYKKSPQKAEKEIKEEREKDSEIKPTKTQRGMYYAAKRKGYQGTVDDWIKENPNAVSQRDANKLKPKMSKKEAGQKAYASGLADLMKQKSAYATPTQAGPNSGKTNSSGII